MGLDAAHDTLAARDERDAAYAVLPPPFRWILGFAHSPFWLGAGAGAAYLLSAAAVFGAAGAARGSNTVLADLSYALWFAWVPIGIAHFVRGTERDALELAPILAAEGPARQALRREVLDVSPRAPWFGAGIGVLLASALAAFAFGVMEKPPAGGEAVFTALRELVIEIAAFSVFGWAVGASFRLSRITSARARPSLLDLEGFRPLTRNGSRLALHWLVLNAIALPVILAPPAAMGAEGVRILLLTWVVLTLFVAVALVIPTHGAHQVIRAAKIAELACVRSQIAEARATRGEERLPGLLAWESRVERVSEWPIDAAALRRLGLYLLIPLASWVGGALVERLVDAALG